MPAPPARCVRLVVAANRCGGEARSCLRPDYSTQDGWATDPPPVSKGGHMTTSRSTLRVGLTAAIFAVGFLCGSVSQRNADAQLKELGGQAVEKAAGSGGPIGQAATPGTSIVDMQKTVDSLQKNLDTLKEIKSALGG